MPDRQIFFDPQRKRWKRLRRILDATAVVSTLVLAVFIFNVLRYQQLPELLLPVPRHNYKALPDRTPLLRGAKGQRPARRKTGRKPSDIPFNTGEGLRAAYYVAGRRGQLLLVQGARSPDRSALSPVAAHRRARGNAAGDEQRHTTASIRYGRRHSARPRRR